MGCGLDSLHDATFKNWGHFVSASVTTEFRPTEFLCNMLRGQTFVPVAEKACHTRKTVAATCSRTCVRLMVSATCPLVCAADLQAGHDNLICRWSSFRVSL